MNSIIIYNTNEHTHTHTSTRTKNKTKKEKRKEDKKKTKTFDRYWSYKLSKVFQEKICFETFLKDERDDELQREDGSEIQM